MFFFFIMMMHVDFICSTLHLKYTFILGAFSSPHSVPAAAEESLPSEDACRRRPHAAGRGGARGPGRVSHAADGGVELGPRRAGTAGTRRQSGQVGGARIIMMISSKTTR